MEQSQNWTWQQALEEGKNTLCKVETNVPSCGLKTRKEVADLYIDDRACVPIYEEEK